MEKGVNSFLARLALIFTPYHNMVRYCRSAKCFPVEVNHYRHPHSYSTHVENHTIKQSGLSTNEAHGHFHNIKMLPD